MKILLLTACIAQSCSALCFADGARFRFHRMTGVTGLPCVISDASGKKTTIRFSATSDPEAKYVLDSLISKEGIWGSLKAEVDPRGIIWDQGVILLGTFSSEEALTEFVENGAAQEPFKEFKLTGIQVQMPFAQWIQTDKDDPISSPYVVVYHLSLDSIFPNGLSFEGKNLDLRAYEAKSQSEQGGTGQPATRSQSKSEGNVKPRPEAEGAPGSGCQASSFCQNEDTHLRIHSIVLCSLACGSRDPLMARDQGVREGCEDDQDRRGCL